MNCDPANPKGSGIVNVRHEKPFLPGAGKIRLTAILLAAIGKHQFFQWSTL